MDPPLSRGEERSLKTVVDQSWIRHPRHLPPPQTNALYFPSISQHFVRLQSVIGDTRAGVTISHYGPQ